MTTIDIDAYRFRVHLLEGRMKHLLEQAELHGSWDDYYWARRKWRNARDYLRRKERQLAALTGGCRLAIRDL